MRLFLMLMIVSIINVLDSKFNLGIMNEFKGTHSLLILILACVVAIIQDYREIFRKR